MVTKPFVVENVFYELDPSWFLSQPYSPAICHDPEQPVSKVRVNRIDLKIKVLDARKTAYIEAIKVDKNKSSPVIRYR